MSQWLLRARPAAVASGLRQLWSSALVSLPPVLLGFLSARRALSLHPTLPAPGRGKAKVEL